MRDVPDTAEGAGGRARTPRWPSPPPPTTAAARSSPQRFPTPPLQPATSSSPRQTCGACGALKSAPQHARARRYPLLREVTIGIDPMQIFAGAQWALMVGAKPRGPGMERADLLQVGGGRGRVRWRCRG